MADPKSGWREVLNDSRRDYRRKQIRAAVRRNPGTAAEELKRLGYVIVDPKDSLKQALIRRLIGVPKQRPASSAETSKKRSRR